MRACDCDEPGCPNHREPMECVNLATTTVRIADREGLRLVPMCRPCAEQGEAS